jgi:hypothetical protein
LAEVIALVLEEGELTLETRFVGIQTVRIG